MADDRIYFGSIEDQVRQKLQQVRLLKIASSFELEQFHVPSHLPNAAGTIFLGSVFALHSTRYRHLVFQIPIG